MLWDIVAAYVKEKHPNVPVDHNNSKAGGYRFRIRVSKTAIEITDAGKSPGMDAPEDFPRKVVRAADPDFFKKLSKACRYRGRGGVCVYQDNPYKLKAGWTMVAAPDLIAIHDPAIEQMLISKMTKDLKKRKKKK